MYFNRILAAGVSVAAIIVAATAARAQSSGTLQVEEIVISAHRVTDSMGGLLSAEQIAKSRSSITQDYIETQSAGQTVAQSLNLLPGVNFTNSDPYGSSGGNIRLRSFDGNRISLTFDGMPLNDTGNYAIFTNQLVDPEIIERTVVNIGTTDVDSPTAAATGGTINVRTRRPADNFGMTGAAALGDYDYHRAFVMMDTGALGTAGTAAFLSYSYQKYDKFRGPGNLEKQQYNGKIVQPIGEGNDFLSLAFHYNQNRNNFYRNLSKADVAFYGYRFDNLATCTLASRPGGAGAQNDGATTVALATTPQFRSANDNPANPSACTNFFRLRVNPSNTGNLRAQSKFSITDDLTVTVDPSFQYVLANGGGTTVISETDGRLRGASGTGVDLNGDGDQLDSVRLYTPNNTNTRRFGVISSLIYQVSDEHTVRAAYTLDYGRHRQTGQFAAVLADGSPSNIFGGLKGTPVKSADGFDLRGRDRFSFANLHQVAINYDGSFLDDTVHLSVGVRQPFFRRKLNQFCYTQYQTSTAYCTTQVPSAPTPNIQVDGSIINTVTFATSPGAGATTRYVAPFKGTRKYDKTLPNVGLSVHPFGDEHLFYFSFAQGLAAPRTDNLYSFEILDVQPETTNAYDLGYRFQRAGYLASLALWKTDFKNRIVTAFDPNLGINVDRNIGAVDLYGFDFEAGITPIEDLNIYGSISYNHSKVLNNIQSGTVVFQTAGKRLVETPTWTYSGRISYKINEFTFGAQAKYVGRRFSTDVNDEFTPSYATVDANIRYSLDHLALPVMKAAYLQFNVINLFNKDYLASISSQFSTTAGTPLYSVGAPRTFQMSLNFTF